MAHRFSAKSGSSLVGKEDLEKDRALQEFAARLPLEPDEEDGKEENGLFSLLMKVADLVEDKFALYDLLADEAESGSDAALDLMNEIWPPEQIIEED